MLTSLNKMEPNELKSSVFSLRALRDPAKAKRRRDAVSPPEARFAFGGCEGGMRRVHTICKILIIAALCTAVYGVAFTQEERGSPFIPQLPIKIEIIPTQGNESAFLPPQEVKKVFNVKAYNLEGVVWGAYAPKAIINSGIYGIGDKLEEAEIKGINKEGVTVLFYDEEYVIRTKNPFVAIPKEEVSNETSETIEE